MTVKKRFVVGDIEVETIYGPSCLREGIRLKDRGYFIHELDPHLSARVGYTPTGLLRSEFVEEHKLMGKEIDVEIKVVR